MKKKKWPKRLLYTLLVIIIMTNVIAYNHAWHFTHYTRDDVAKTKYERLGLMDKIIYGFKGVDNPRPENDRTPALPYETIHIKSNVNLECWYIQCNSAKGTVLMFHGYTGCKSKMLERAYIIHDMGYNIMLADMMGTGGSEGNNVTIGYKEARNVTDCYRYSEQKGEHNIILFGTSMGGAAIMKAVTDDQLQPKCIVAEAPFASMYKAVTNRFDMVGAPYFPMAQLLVFWGGIQNGFWAFDHKPAVYAKHIEVPFLLMYGGKDDRVMREETDEIYSNLSGVKQLSVYPEAGHVRYLEQYRERWTNDISNFFNRYAGKKQDMQ